MAAPTPVEIALKAQQLQNEIEYMQHEIDELKLLVADMKKERDSLMKWGVITLGAAVVGMGLYIWNLLTTGHLK